MDLLSLKKLVMTSWWQSHWRRELATRCNSSSLRKRNSLAKDKSQARRHQHQDKRTLLSLCHQYPKSHNTINISNPNRAVTRSMRPMTSNQCRMLKVKKMTMTLVASLVTMDHSSMEQMAKTNPIVSSLTLLTSEYWILTVRWRFTLFYSICFELIKKEWW